MRESRANSCIQKKTSCSIHIICSIYIKYSSQLMYHLIGPVNFTRYILLLHSDSVAKFISWILFSSTTLSYPSNHQHIRFKAYTYPKCHQLELTCLYSQVQVFPTSNCPNVLFVYILGQFDPTNVACTRKHVNARHEHHGSKI